jgi:DNA-binding MarR family transcriptional regulator
LVQGLTKRETSYVFDKETLKAYIAANQKVIAQSTGGQQITLAVLNTLLGAAVWGSDKTQGGEPATLEDLADHLGTSPTTISLHMRYLGDKYRADQPGLELVTTEIYPLNRRKKTFRLTRRGEALAKQLASTLEGRRASKATP